MVLHVNQTILGEVQIGRCSGLDDVNPYEPQDRKRYLGWEQGHKTMIESHRQHKKHKAMPWYRKILCQIGVHKYTLKLIPGRPRIGFQTGLSIGRDPIIKKYVCDCGDTYFIGLGGGE